MLIYANLIYLKNWKISSDKILKLTLRFLTGCWILWVFKFRRCGNLLHLYGDHHAATHAQPRQPVTPQANPIHPNLPHTWKDYRAADLLVKYEKYGTLSINDATWHGGGLSGLAPAWPHVLYRFRLKGLLKWPFTTDIGHSIWVKLHELIFKETMVKIKIFSHISFLDKITLHLIFCPLSSIKFKVQ